MSAQSTITSAKATHAAATPVFLTAQWRYLAMVNFAVEPALLQPHVPAGVELDFHAGQTFVSLVGFVFDDTRVGGWAIPWHRSFPEVNLRFYVRREVRGEVRRGVVFIKEIVPLPAVTLIARGIYGENYHTQRMRHEIDAQPDRTTACYAWQAAARWHRLAVSGSGPLAPPEPGSEAEFIIEHYWGYTRRASGATHEYRVAHRPWNVWPHCTADLELDATAIYGPAFGDVLSRPPTSVLLADGSDVAVHRGTVV